MSNRVKILERISVDPAACFGKPVVKGTRIWVSLILDNLSAGVSEAELIAAYPQLNVEDIRACLAYGAELARRHMNTLELDPAPV